MGTNDTKLFLQSDDKTRTTPRHSCDLPLGIFGRLFPKPVRVVKEGVFLRDVPVFANDGPDSESVKSHSHGVRSTADHCGDLICIESVPMLPGKPFHVFEKVRSRSLFTHMGPEVNPMRKDDKVFWSVVGPISVHVMHLFCWQQVAAKSLLHYKAMFKHVARSLGKWMVRHLDGSIPINDRHSTIPLPMRFSLVRDYSESAFSFHNQCLHVVI